MEYGRHIGFALVLMCLMIPFIAIDEDAASAHLGGEGHGEGIDVVYSSVNDNIATVTLATRPTLDVTIIVLSDDDDQSIGPIEAQQVIHVFLRPLSEGTYTFMVVIESTGAIIAQCDVEVGYRYSVTFYSNGGSGQMTGSEVMAGSSFRLPSCTFTPPSGSQFSSWSIDGSLYQTGEMITVTSDTFVRAVWTEKESEGLPMMVIIGIAALLIVLFLVVLFIVRRHH
jgi:hypothetical protein